MFQNALQQAQNAFKRIAGGIGSATSSIGGAVAGGAHQLPQQFNPQSLSALGQTALGFIPGGNYAFKLATAPPSPKFPQQLAQLPVEMGKDLAGYVKGAPAFFLDPFISAHKAIAPKQVPDQISLGKFFNPLQTYQSQSQQMQKQGVSPLVSNTLTYGQAPLAALAGGHMLEGGVHKMGVSLEEARKQPGGLEAGFAKVPGQDPLQLFRGSQGKVTPEAKTFERVLSVEGDQRQLMSQLAQGGDKQAQVILNSKNFFMNADKYLKDKFGSKYDAIQYKNTDMPQKGVEYHDLQGGKFYATNKETASIYARQARGGKYTIPLLSPTEGVPPSQPQNVGGGVGGGVLEGPQKYVDNKPLELNVSANPKTTAQDIRDSYSGSKNRQANVVAQLAKEIKRIVPDKTEREALTLLRDIGADITKLQEAYNDPAFAKYKPAIEKALNPTPQMAQAELQLRQYYQEAGQTGQQYGFLNELRDNYINRIYKPEQPNAFVSIETQRGGLPQSTSHAKGRYYTTLFDAIKAGKEPATLDSSDLAIIHGQEFAKVLTNNKLYEALKQTGLGDKFEQGQLPPNYRTIGNSSFAVPDWLHTGIKAITEPNFINKIDEIRGLRKYQGLVKTIDLSVSLFHHFTMAMQALYQTKFGLEIPKVLKLMQSADFNKMENDGVAHTLMTANIDANKEVLASISKGNSIFDKAAQLPIIKQGFKAIEVNNEFLFGKMQRWLKVMDYGTKVSSWIDKHPTATNEEIVMAKRGFAREINAAYGGLNWESLGKTPSFQGLGRLLLLAPDWTYSNIELFKQAAGKGTAGSAARSHVISAIVGGAVLTEGLNKVLTGHYTNQNAKGHETEVEVRPGVYMSFFRGGIGDALKLASYTKESGPLQGTSRFAQGKLSPLLRTGVGLLAGVDYNGNPIYPQGASATDKTIAGAKFLASSALPVPFSARPIGKLAGKKNMDPLSYGLVGTGIARPGAASTQQQLQKEKYFDAYNATTATMTDPKDKAAWQMYKTINKNDANGRAIADSILLRYPNIFNAERDLQIQTKGKADPLYTSLYAQDYLKYQQLKQTAMGSTEEKQFAKNHPGVITLGQQRSKYFQENPIQGISGTTLQAPQPSPRVSGLLSAGVYNDPEVVQYLQNRLTYVNAIRTQQQGLEPLDKYGNILGSKNYGVTFGGGGGNQAYLKRQIQQKFPIKKSVKSSGKIKKVKIAAYKPSKGKKVKNKHPKIAIRSSRGGSITNYSQPRVLYS